MAKALKTAAIVAGIGALAVVTGGAALGLGVSLGTAAFGVSASSLLLASTALSVGSALLTKKPEAPAAQVERLHANVNPRAFRTTAFGSTALATDIRYVEWFGADQDRCGWITAHASHAIAGVDQIWLDDELAWTAASGTQGKFRDYFWVRRIITEGSPAAAFRFGSGAWNESSRLTGCAYSLLEFKTSGNNKKTESPFANGIPTRVTVIGRGAPLYDPRRDSTVPGGSGPMRAADPSTWRYVTDDGVTIGENLALQILRYLIGGRINGKLATGCGVPIRRIDLASFLVAANQCDELVNRSAGGMEPRFAGAGVVSEGDDRRKVLDMMLAACCGRFRDTTGKLAIAIMHNDLAGAATDPGLGDDDLVGPFTWDPDPSTEATPNIIRGQYTDPSTSSLYQPVDFPEVAIASFDGTDRVLPFDLPWVESPSQAQRVVKQVLQRKQFQRRFSAPFDITAWRYNVGDLVPLTIAALGFNRQLFRVVETDPGANPCQMVLEWESPAIYAWDADDRAPVQAAPPVVYDRSNSTMLRAVADLDSAIVQILSDNVITHGREKRELVLQWAGLEAQFEALDAQYLALGSPSDLYGARSDALVAYQALAAMLAGLAPPWDQVESDTSVDGASLASRWQLARARMEQFAAAITGRPGESAYSLILSNENHTFAADAQGNVLSYAGGETSVQVLYGSQDVTSLFVAAAPLNPQGLAVTGAYPNFAVTDGFDAGEETAAFTFNLVGTGPHDGVALQKTMSLSKSKAAIDGTSPPLITLTSDKAFAAFNKDDNYVGGAITFTAVRQNIPGTQTYFQIIRVSDGVQLDANTSDGYGGYPGGHYAGSGGDKLVIAGFHVEGLIRAFGAIRIVAYRDGYNVTDSITIAKVKDGATGAGAFTLIPLTSATAVGPNYVRSSGSYGGWGTQAAYTRESYANGAIASWLIPPDSPGDGANTMAGLTNHPGLNPGGGATLSYDMIRFAIHRNNGGGIHIFSDGADQKHVKVVDPKTTTNICQVYFDGRSTVRFYVDGAEVHSLPYDPAAGPLCFAAAMASTNPRLEEITFAAAGQRGLDGKSALSGTLSNESHLFPADVDGNVTDYSGGGGQFRVFLGTTDVTSSCSFAVIAGSHNGAEFIAPIGADGSYVCTALNPPLDAAWADYRATYQGQTITLRYSVAKSKAPRAGVSPPLVRLNATASTVRYDTANVFVPGQSITFSSTRTSTTGTPLFAIINVDGTVIYGPTYASAIASAFPAHFTSANVDTLHMTSDGVGANMNAHGGAAGRFTIEVQIEGQPHVRDRVSVQKVKDGDAGEDGASSFTLLDFANCHSPGPNFVVKRGGGNDWNGKAVTAERYPGGATFGGKMEWGTFIGLDTSTGEDATYASIQYALHISEAGPGIVGVYRNGPGASFWSGGSWTVPSGTRGWITHDNKTVRYFIEGRGEIYSHPVDGPDELLNGVVAIGPVGRAVREITFAPAGKSGNNSISAVLSNESHTLAATVNGVVFNYAGAEGFFNIYDGTAIVTDAGANGGYWTLSLVGNPQGLIVNFTGRKYVVSGGFDSNEDSASITIRASGSGPYAGTIIDKVFSLAKSKTGSTGANGADAKVMILASTHQTVTIDKAGAVVPQTTTFTAQPKNSGGTRTVWRLLDANGVPRTGHVFANTLAAILGGSFNGDNEYSIDAATLVAHMNSSGQGPQPGLIFEVAYDNEGSIFDRISIVRVADGTNGTNGSNGSNGTNAGAITVSASPTTIRYNKAGQIVSGDVTFTASRDGAVYGPINWASVEGHGVYGTGGVTFSGDTMTWSQQRVHDVLNHNIVYLGRNSAAVRANVGAVSGVATITRVDDGQDGTDGKDGTDGRDGTDGAPGQNAGAVTVSGSTAATLTLYVGGTRVYAASEAAVRLYRGGGDGTGGQTCEIYASPAGQGQWVVFASDYYPAEYNRPAESQVAGSWTPPAPGNYDFMTTGHAFGAGITVDRFSVTAEGY